MCLKIQSPWPLPEETGRIGKMLLDEDDPYRLIGDQLFAKWKEEEFADLYAREGKPGYLPVILAFVSVFQFMERLADRQAAHGVDPLKWTVVGLGKGAKKCPKAIQPILRDCLITFRYVRGDEDLSGSSEHK